MEILQRVTTTIDTVRTAPQNEASAEKTNILFIIVVVTSVAAALARYPVAGASCFVVYVAYTLIKKLRVRLLRQTCSRSLERELPLIAEKLLMAVRSGYDLVPALSLIGALSEEPHSLAKKFTHFALRCEQGERLESVLRAEAHVAQSVAFKHMCLHLAIAHKEGGELSKSLEELSDATQNFVEESENEAIAKLPVKATLPLVIVFVGLITCFVTPPLVQIVHALKEATVQ